MTANANPHTKARLGGMVVTRLLTATDVRVSHGVLEWRTGYPRYLDLRVLTEFAALSDLEGGAFEIAVVGFAERWGALALTTTGRPCAEPMRIAGSRGHVGRRHRADTSPARPFAYRSRIKHWRQWSNFFRTLREIGDALRNGGIGLDGQWEDLRATLAPGHLVIGSLGRTKGKPIRRDTVAYHRTLFVSYLSELARLADLRPVAVWTPGIESPRAGIDLRLLQGDSIAGIGSLFAGLVTALLLELSDGTDHVLCDVCRRRFRPTRKPRVSQRKYCPACRAKRFPQRLAKQDYDARERERRIAAGRDASPQT